MEISEFVRLELIVVGALFAGLALLIPKILKAARGSPFSLQPPPPLPNNNDSTGIRLIIERLGSIDRRLERADESRSKFHARLDKQAEALAEHERGCYERAGKTELRLGRIEDILERSIGGKV